VLTAVRRQTPDPDTPNRVPYRYQPPILGPGHRRHRVV